MRVIEMDTSQMTEAQFIEWYKANEKGKYETPSMTTDMIIFTNEGKDLKLLLIQRKQHPFKGSWAFPGGFVNMDEDLDTGAARELKEETGLENVYATQLYTWSDVDRDPRMRVISASYLALVNEQALLQAKAADDAEDVARFVVDCPVVFKKQGTQQLTLTLTHREKGQLTAKLNVHYTLVGKQLKEQIELLESNGIGFDHAKAIVYAILRMREQIQYTPIALELLQDKFSIEQVAQAYEAIANDTVPKAIVTKFIEKQSDNTYTFKQVNM